MTKFKSAALAALALAGAALAPPTAAVAQSRGYYDDHGRFHRTAYRHYAEGRRTCGAEKRAHGNNGTAIGAVTGGVLGSAMGNGRLGNVLLGAGAGAVAGHYVGRGTVRC